MSSGGGALQRTLRASLRALKSEGGQHVGGCSSSISNLFPPASGHGLCQSLLRRGFRVGSRPPSPLLAAFSAGRSRVGDRLLKRELESFVRQWRGRGFKAVAVGTGASVGAQANQGLYNLVVPTALWMLWWWLPPRYRHYAFRLLGYPDAAGAQCAKRPGPSHASDDASSRPGLLSALLSHLQLSSLLSSAAQELLLALRALYLCALFTPAVLGAPIVALLGLGREQWLSVVQWTLEHAGPAFIKWGQWASTRPDLFPEDLCLRLEQLQSAAPAHPAAQTVTAVERAFNSPISQLFEHFEMQPVASGSVAQIHVARLSARGAELVGGGLQPGTRVAIKVRHPGVSDIMHRDFILMQRAARLCSALPALSELRLEESIRQFGGPLKEQLDLSVEAAHLQRFNANFRSWRSSVAFPVPLYPLVTPDVLVESFEEGDLITRYVRSPHRHNATLAQTGVNVFLNMMLKDNFIHADLHPGNIIVEPPPTPSRLAQAAAPYLPLRVRSWLLDRSPRIVLLDTGMIVELSGEDQAALLGFFRCLTQMDGKGLAGAILRMSVGGECKDPVAFAGELDSMFSTMDREYLRKESQAVMRDVIDKMRQHQVTLRSSVSTVVVTSLVLEGWSSKLDPDVRILETMREMLATDWADRMSRTVDRIMNSGQTMELAVA